MTNNYLASSSPPFTYAVRVGVGCAGWRAAAGGEDARPVPDTEEAPRRHFESAEDQGVCGHAHWTRLPALSVSAVPNLWRVNRRTVPG